MTEPQAQPQAQPQPLQPLVGTTTNPPLLPTQPSTPLPWWQQPSNGWWIHIVSQVGVNAALGLIQLTLDALNGPNPPVVLNPTILILVNTLVPTLVSALRHQNTGTLVEVPEKGGVLNVR